MKPESMVGGLVYVCVGRLGELLMKLNRPEEAQEYYRKALKIDPDNRQNLERYASFLATYDMEDALIYYQVGGLPSPW